MTPAEFKAWFDGFTEAMTGMPTKAQWTRIKERVGQIDGSPLTREVIYKYWPWYTHYPYYTPTYSGWSSVSGCSSVVPLTSTDSLYISTNYGGNDHPTDNETVYNTLTAIGKNEYLASLD